MDTDDRPTGERIVLKYDEMLRQVASQIEHSSLKHDIGPIFIGGHQCSSLNAIGMCLKSAGADPIRACFQAAQHRYNDHLDILLVKQAWRYLVLASWLFLINGRPELKLFFIIVVVFWTAADQAVGPSRPAIAALKDVMEKCAFELQRLDTKWNPFDGQNWFYRRRLRKIGWVLKGIEESHALPNKK